jgi:hypothetical protein
MPEIGLFGSEGGVPIPGIPTPITPRRDIRNRQDRSGTCRCFGDVGRLPAERDSLASDERPSIVFPVIYSPGFTG